MTHASLFSGIGGAELAATWMGWENVFHCEINPYGRKVLEYWYPKSTSYEDITRTDFTVWRGKIDVLTGGFPCQPFSVAGSRKGADDDRYLWPEMLRAIREVQPAWVVGENVAEILTMVQPGSEAEVGSGSALFDENRIYRTEQQFVTETVCQDLERAGYAVQPFVIPACAVGAPHRRDRVWFVAKQIAPDATVRRDTPREAREGTEGSRRDDIPQQEERGDQAERPDGLPGFPRAASDTESTRSQRECKHEQRKEELNGRDSEDIRSGFKNFPTQSPVCGGDDGLSLGLAGITFPKWRAEAVKALGNAWVPQVAYEIFKAIGQCQDR